VHLRSLALEQVSRPHLLIARVRYNEQRCSFVLALCRDTIPPPTEQPLIGTDALNVDGTLALGPQRGEYDWPGGKKGEGEDAAYPNEEKPSSPGPWVRRGFVVDGVERPNATDAKGDTGGFGRHRWRWLRT